MFPLYGLGTEVCFQFQILLKGGPEPSILDDLCLGNVTSKYFSKLRIGTSKRQAELKCLENILKFL